MITIHNRHIAACGTPPKIEDSDARWMSYFENSDREQYIFLVDKAGKAFLYVGDAGWAKPREIEFSGDFCTKLADLRSEEELWVRACWNTSYWARGDKEGKTKVILFPLNNLRTRENGTLGFDTLLQLARQSKSDEAA